MSDAAGDGPAKPSNDEASTRHCAARGRERVV